jgi:SAM-dependent methyltransferase
VGVVAKKFLQLFQKKLLFLWGIICYDVFMKIQEYKKIESPKEEKLVYSPEENVVSEFAKAYAQIEYEAEDPTVPYDPKLLERLILLEPNPEIIKVVESNQKERYYQIMKKLLGGLGFWKEAFLKRIDHKYNDLLESSKREGDLSLIGETLSETSRIKFENKNLSASMKAGLNLLRDLSLENLVVHKDVQGAISVAIESIAGNGEKLESEFPLEKWQLNSIFKRDPKFSAGKLLEIVERGNVFQENFPVVVIMIADLLGAEEARQKIETLILKNEDNEKVRNNLENALSMITPYLKPAEIDEKTGELKSEDGDDPQKVEHIKNLQEFYQENIKFEQYKVNEKMNEREVSLLKSLIGKDQKTLEMGCGTGRLIKELSKEGYDISGYDFTVRHVEIAKAEIEKAGGEAKVFQGDWHENAIKSESLDTIYSLGRNILHDYSIVDQAQLFREAARILKPGGKFIFDIPDRGKGGYEKMVKGYADEMEKRGIRNFRYGSIYDSPDGTHFATRYAYSAEDIEELARLSGFKITDIKRLPLETGQGDENLYYVLEKA